MIKKSQGHFSNVSELDDCFRGCLYFAMSRFYRRIDRLAFEAFKNLEMSPSQAFLLMALGKSEGHAASSSVLAKLMDLDRSTLTRLLGQLEEKKYLRRKKTGRQVVVYLQVKGLEFLPKINQCWKNLYQQYCKVLGENNAEALIRLIHKNS